MWAEEFGVGELGLLPDEFWGLTVREFHIKHRAFVRAENRARRAMAEYALLINGSDRYQGKPRTPERLLGYGKPMDLYPRKAWMVPDEVVSED